MQYQIMARGFGGTPELEKLEEQYAGLGEFNKVYASGSYLLELWTGERSNEIFKGKLLNLDNKWGSLYDVYRQEEDGSVDHEFRCDDKIVKGKGIAKERNHSFSVE